MSICKTDRCTWVAHLVVCLIIAVVYWLWALIPHPLLTVFDTGTCFGLGAYFMREYMDGWKGWSTVGDLAGPVLLFLVCFFL